MRGLATWVRSSSLVPWLRLPVRDVLIDVTDEKVWTDPEFFRPERWFEQPDAPLFTYGVGYRMCAGSLLANRELYLVFIRLLNSFYIKKYDDVDCHPITGNADPKSLVALPPRFKSYFVPRNDTALRAAVEKAS